MIPRHIMVILLIGIGIGVYFASLPFVIQTDNEPIIQAATVCLAAIIAFAPFMRKSINSAFARIRESSSSGRRWIAFGIAIISGPFLYALGALRGRLMLPIWHDESMYRMQTTFLAHGRFSMPGLPLPDFFQSPYIFVRDIYAPVYFPGTALLHVPGDWLHLPYCLTPLVIATVILVLLFLIVTELLDALAGLMAVLLMISLPVFRWLSLVEMSHVAALMWQLVAVWAWLSWRRQKKLRWACIGGLAGGFFAITRPLDAIVLLLPIAFAWALDLRRLTRRNALTTLSAVLVSALPFFALQLAFNRSLTGHFLKTPLDLYNQTMFHANSIGLQQPDLNFVPPTPVGLIQKLYTSFDRPRMLAFTTAAAAVRYWIVERMPTTLALNVPSPYLLILLPVSLLGLKSRCRRLLWLLPWFFLIGAGVFYVFLRYYTIAAAPGLIFAVLLAVEVIRQQWPGAVRSLAFISLVVLMLAVQAIAVNRQNVFEPIPSAVSRQGSISRFNYRQIPDQVTKPALVFFHFDPSEDVWEEPVYNWSVLNPDDAPVIRAHDLGADRDLQLLEYYRTRRPDLHIYMFDRRTLQLKSLGNIESAITVLEQSTPAAGSNATERN